MEARCPACNAAFTVRIESAVPVPTLSCADCGKTITARRKDGSAYKRCYKCSQAHFSELPMCACGLNRYDPVVYDRCYQCAKSVRQHEPARGA